MQAIAVAAGLDGGAAEQLRRLGAEVVGAVMVDGEERETGVVALVFLMLGKREVLPGGSLAHRAVAGEAAVGSFPGGQAQIGMAAGGGAVGVAVGLRRIVHFHARHFAVVLRRFDFGAGGEQRLVVPAGDGDGIGQGVADFLPGLDGVARLGRVVAMKTQDGLRQVGQFGLAVEDFQAVAGVRGLVAGHRALVVAEAEGQTFLGEQAAAVVEVGLAVLDGQAVAAQFLGDALRPVGLRMVGEELAEDLEHRLVLEDVAVATLAQQGEPGFHDQSVTGETAVGAELQRLGDVAVPGALATVGLQQAQGDFLAAQRQQVEAGAGGKCSRSRSGTVR